MRLLPYPTEHPKTKHTAMQNLSDTLLNGTGDVNATTSRGHTSSSIVTALLLIWMPGIITNVLALFFIIRDIKKAVFPAMILLLVLCLSDLTAVCLSITRHMITRYVHSVTYAMCASVSTFHIYFRLFTGVVNTLMATDRVIAICMPFYYKSHVEAITWKLGCIIAAVAVACINCLPIIGLGNYMGTRSSGVVYCSSLGFKANPLERVFGIVNGILGLACVIAIVILNCIVIRSVLRLNNRIRSITDTTTTTESDGTKSSKANVTSFEIAFAKLMGCLAVVYLVCGTPYSVQVLVQQFDYRIDGVVIGYIHLLGGFSYTIDPIVYILIRKTNRKRLAELFCFCKRERVVTINKD